jgi:hypothetical protein
MSKARYADRRNAFLNKMNNLIATAEANNIDPEKALATWFSVQYNSPEHPYAAMDPELIENEQEKVLNKSTGSGMKSPKMSVQDLKTFIKQNKRSQGRNDIRITGMKKPELQQLYNEMCNK